MRRRWACVRDGTTTTVCVWACARVQGVVFNEMKGVYSSPDSLMYRAAQQLTYPDNTYAVDSGGDPMSIPSLTFEQFKSFHDSYYHPVRGQQQSRASRARCGAHARSREARPCAQPEHAG
jgi:hypothetical protein